MHTEIHLSFFVVWISSIRATIETEGAYVLTQEKSYHTSTSSTTVLVHTESECYHQCYRSDTPCLGANLQASLEVGPFKCEIIHDVGGTDGITKQDGWTFMSHVNEKVC